MTNEQIIKNARVSLVKNGTIKADEEIHTYNKWKELGYQVVRGQKAICKLAIWKPFIKRVWKDDEDFPEEQKRMMMQTAAFFSRSQVEAIAEG